MTAAVPLVELELPWPPTGNLSWRVSFASKRFHKSADYVAFLKEVALRVNVARARLDIRHEVAIEIDWVPPDRRRRDISNALKTLEDSLVKAGVLEDDHLIADHRMKRFAPKSPGHCRVRLFRRDDCSGNR